MRRPPSQPSGRETMQSSFSQEQVLFREIVSNTLRELSPMDSVRGHLDSALGYDPEVWRRLTSESDLAGTHIPETLGGAGLGDVELGIVAEEMGRTLYTGPFFSSAAMAGTALIEAPEGPFRDETLGRIASGELLATLVTGDLADLSSIEGLRIDAAGALRGEAPLVVDAARADRWIVLAEDQGEAVLVAVDRGAEGVVETRRQSLDPTRRLGRLRFDGAVCAPVGPLDRTSLERLSDRLCVALAHEMIGGARQLLESTVEYTKQRVQFGRPIGSFQGLKHRCADLLMELELAAAVVHHAARVLDGAGGDAWTPSLAKAMASDVYIECAKAGIQLRGGIGFTWEDDTHLWYKRAKSSEVLFGAAHVHRERAIQRMEAAQ
ncbi:MAG: acyl-CoA dehydrogenase family protein [Acidobacteriota bacterium]